MQGLQRIALIKKILQRIAPIKKAKKKKNNMMLGAKYMSQFKIK